MPSTFLMSQLKGHEVMQLPDEHCCQHVESFESSLGIENKGIITMLIPYAAYANVPDLQERR